MELVYLWVEEYKNIYHQGFNFSPRFDCKFDGENLTIEEKEYTSIFPDNINITAIVGENGSGKSSIGGLFISLKLFSNKELNSILILEKNNSLYISTDIKINIQNNSNLNILKKLKDYSPLLTLLQENDFNIDTLKEEKLLFKEFEFLLNKNISGKTNEEKLKGIGFIDKDIYNLGRNFFSIISEFSSRDNQITGNSYRVIRPLERKEMNEFETFIDNIDILNYIIKFLGFNFTAIKNQKNEIRFQFPNDTETIFGHISFGQKYSIHLFSSIYNRIKNNKEAIFLLDEVTLSLHPNLEKKFISFLITLVQKIKTIEKIDVSIHFIITSHSPFILSDIPKENVIFLKNKNGNCENITKNANIDTFGANIHTLLSHGFFMEDGLMGEFAKEKINEVIKILQDKRKKSKKNIEYCKNIISLIGEPVLKKTLENMLKEKIGSIISKEDQISALKEKREKLQKQIDKLEGKSNENS